MKTITSARGLLIPVMLLPVFVFSQVNRAFNQNSSRSNHTRQALSFYFSPVYNNALGKSDDSLLFRGSGAGLKFGGDYFFSSVGLGVLSGFSSGKADESLVNDFLKRSGFPQDAVRISRAAQQQFYLLAGPSFRWGKTVQFFAHAKGGLFINNGGLVDIRQQGAQRSLYRNEATDKSLYPGFMSGLGLQYSNAAQGWSFGFGADYLATRTQLQNYDIRRGGAIEGLQLSRSVSDLMAGVTFRYTIRSPRDASSGQASGKRSVVTAREPSSGMATGKRTREVSSGQASGRRVMEEITEILTDSPGTNCGPVTQRVTHPDGRTEEMVFSCPDDAAAYKSKLEGGMPNRLSMNVTVPKQTQGATFGEKVNSGLQQAGNALSQGQAREGIVHRDLAARNILLHGKVQLISPATTGIITNQTPVKSAGPGSGAAAASYAATGRMADGGTVLNLYSREAGSGMATGKRTREAGSGIATGKRQHKPVFFEGGDGGACDNCGVQVKLATVKNNPLYKGSTTETNNPLYKSRTAGGGDDDCDGIAGLEVLLTDPQSGAVIATTKTGQCGEYYFANLPAGVYAVRVSGAFESSKTYEATLSTAADIEGQLLTGNAAIQLSAQVIETATPVSGPAGVEAILKTKTKSNQSNDRQAAGNEEEGIWSPRSNIHRIIPVSAGDLDGDGSPELVAGQTAEREVVKKYFQNGDIPDQQRMAGGALPGGAVISSALMRPGNPIRGMTVKGGRNPGGDFGGRTSNEAGYFEFSNLEPGAYLFTTEQRLVIDETVLVEARDYNSSRSNKTGNKSAVQDHNSSRSNKSSSIAAPDPDEDEDGRARDYNSSRSNKTGNKSAVQDHNSSRSNKSSSAVDDNTGGTDKLVASKGDVKLTASQNSQSLRSIAVQADLDGDGVFETDVTGKVTDELTLSPEGTVGTPQQKAGVSTSRSNIRNRHSVEAVTQTVYTGYGTAIINGKEVPVKAVYKVVEKATSGLKDTLKTQV